MIQNKATIIIKYLILLGTIAMALNILFGENTIVYVSRELIPHTTMVWYKYDFQRYITNLTTQITDTTTLNLNLPQNRFDDFINGLITLCNYFIFLNNLLLWPFKLGGYIMNFILAIFGINVGAESGLHWLGVFAGALSKVEIPLIPYS